jgi:hypothetical protein
MDSQFTVTRIKRSTLARIRELAEQGHRSVPHQLDLMTEVFTGHIEYIQPPADADPEVQPIPVVTVQS